MNLRSLTIEKTAAYAIGGPGWNLTIRRASEDLAATQTTTRFSTDRDDILDEVISLLQQEKSNDS